MSMDQQKVLHIAKLSRLTLSDEECALYGGQLSSIFKYIEKLNELDTKSVEPTSHVLDIANVARKDDVAQSLSVQEALANAPDPSGNFYRVPKIIE